MTAKSTKLLVARLSDIDIRSSRTVTIDGKLIALFRLTDGTIRALDNKCPHKGGVLSEGMVCGSTLHCPLHDLKLDLHTGKAHAPDEGSVTAYEVEVDPSSGDIFITI